ncbi:hypothetical protein DL93DRAFT_2077628 [Clavulina sp. PMI_390]|nr:hypothetical protein DL93DRAFT_2077628 [Clavulina sp. PMI_390]
MTVKPVGPSPSVSLSLGLTLLIAALPAFVCSWSGCTESFANNKSLATHMKTHSDHREFFLDILY